MIFFLIFFLIFFFGGGGGGLLDFPFDLIFNEISFLGLPWVWHLHA